MHVSGRRCQAQTRDRSPRSTLRPGGRRTATCRRVRRLRRCRPRRVRGRDRRRARAAARPARSSVPDRRLSTATAANARLVAVVDHQADVALLPQVNRLGAMAPGESESEVLQQRLDVLARDLGERVAAERRRRRQLALEHDQRAHRVDRHPARVGGAEDVVEDLERQWPAITGGEHVAEKAVEVEGALAGKAPVVAAPLQHVHRHPRRVGELDEEELVAGDLLDSGRIRAAREDVEAVEADAERGMVGALHDPPRVLVVVDVATPRERLVRDPQPASGRALGQLVQLGGGERVVVDRIRRDVGAHQQQLGAELLHHVELRLGAPRSPARARPRSHETAGRDRASGPARRAVRGSGRARAVTRSGRARTARLRRSRRAATASSFSSSVPLRQTVAIERLMPSAPRNGAASAHGRDAGP